MTVMAASPATEQSQAIPSQPGSGPSPTSTTSEDLAASLRAAALRTLKSKRRKLETAFETLPALPSHRPTEPASIQLDYGQEELVGVSTSASSSTKPSAAPASKPVPPPAPSSLKPDQKEQDESQTREEGEISESEPTTPTVPVVKPEPATPQLRSAPQPLLKSQGKPPGLPKPPSIKTEPTVIIVKPPQPPPSAGSVASTSQLVPPRPPPFVIDANHVRPGLEMTQAQYNAAKDIILDLLGWGVPPEFLVSCGVSREIVLYVFSELNLRLPSNLDLTGVVPTPPHGLPDMAQSFNSMAIQGQQSVPRIVPPETPVSQALSANAPPFTPDASASRLPPSPDLIDMEQQRRQELLARKAVLASRKAKQQAASASSTTSSPVAAPATPAATDRKDVEMASAVPTTTVDDFLKSIEPVSETNKGKGKASTEAPAPSSRTSTFDEMDVDEPIPGLSGAYASLPSTARSSSVSLVTSASLTVPPSPTTMVIVQGPIVESPSSSGQSSLNRNSPVHPDDRDNVDAVPGLLSEQLRSYTFDAAVAARRGVKRPVAADFVDMEPGPSRPHSSNSYESFNTPYLHPSQRRKISGSFAGVSGMRRCVINLSDSEDDEMEEDVVNIVLTNGQYEPGDVSMSSAQAASIPVTRPPSRRGTSQIPHGTARRVSPAAAPATLQEKEEEIRKMKELIARRERERLRKVASTSRKSTSPIVAKPHAAVKEEEDDSTGSVSLSQSNVAVQPTNGARSSTAVHVAPISIDVPRRESASSSTSSTSSAATSIDIISGATEHPATNDKVLSAEAQEQAVAGTLPNSTQQEAMKVDVVNFGAETSAQVETSANNVIVQQARLQVPRFIAYSSPLERLPSLRAHSLQYTSEARDTSTRAAPQNAMSVDNPSTSTASLASPLDINSLKLAHVKHLLTDPTKRICQYEVPGGGQCRDSACEDVHLSRIPSVDPSDEETAHFLHTHAVLQNDSRYSVKDIKEALEGIRQHDPTKSFDERVSQVSVMLGLQ